jgi:hypothetical protein
MWNYAIPTLTVVIGLMQLMKDWTAHTTTWRRALVFGAIVLLGIGGIVSAYKNTQRITEQATTIKSLTTAVETSTNNQVANTKVFTNALGALSNKVSNMEVEMKTSDLRQEAAGLRAELAKTQKALVTPQATILSGIVNPDNLDDLSLWTHVMAAPGMPIHVEVVMANSSGVPANAGSLVIRVCAKCKFHSDPPGFQHITGQPDFERTLPFDHLLSGVRSQTIPIDIDEPDAAAGDTIIQFRAICENCVDNGWRTAKISVTAIRIPPVAPVKH